VGALLKPPHLHLHQTSTNFKIPLHNISHDVQPCPYTQQIKKKRKRKGRWNKCRRTWWAPSVIWGGEPSGLCVITPGTVSSVFSQMIW
jgi:hypothetical protein